MSKSWIKDRVKDEYYRKAKAEGYRSRAAYKLLQIQRRFRVVREGDVVVDLGAAPGGWSQVARELVGPEGRVLAVDLGGFAPLEDVAFVKGDARDEAVLAEAAADLDNGADAVLSDMAPNLSGNRTLDHARVMDLAETALAAARRLLREGGNLVTKVFQGDLYPAYLRTLRKEFRTVDGFSPRASPSGSAEMYVVARGWKGSRTAGENL